MNFSLLGWNQHLLLAQGRQLLSVGPIFPCLEYQESHILVIYTASQALDGHLGAIQVQVSKQGDDNSFSLSFQPRQTERQATQNHIHSFPLAWSKRVDRIPWQNREPGGSV